MVRPYQVTKMMDGPLGTREQFVDQIVYSLKFYVNIITIVQSWPVLCNSSFECWNRLVTADKALKVPLDYKLIRKLCIRIRLRRIASCYGCYGWNTDCISKRSNSTWASSQGMLAQTRAMNEWFYRQICKLNAHKNLRIADTMDFTEIKIHWLTLRNTVPGDWTGYLQELIITKPLNILLTPDTWLPWAPHIAPVTPRKLTPW